jgi:hypothetical protein
MGTGTGSDVVTVMEGAESTSKSSSGPAGVVADSLELDDGNAEAGQSRAGSAVATAEAAATTNTAVPSSIEVVEDVGGGASESVLSGPSGKQLRGASSAKVADGGSDGDTPDNKLYARLDAHIARHDELDLLAAASKLKLWLQEEASAVLNSKSVELVIAAALESDFLSRVHRAVAVELSRISARTAAQVADCRLTFEDPPRELVERLMSVVHPSKLRALSKALVECAMAEQDSNKRDAEAALNEVSSVFKEKIEAWRKGKAEGYACPAGCEAGVRRLKGFDVRRELLCIFKEKAATLFAAAVVAQNPVDLRGPAEAAIVETGADRVVVLTPCAVTGETQTYPVSEDVNSNLTRGRFTGALADHLVGRAESTQETIKACLEGPAVGRLLPNAAPVVWCGKGVRKVQQNEFLGGGTDELLVARHEVVEGILEQRPEEKKEKLPEEKKEKLPREVKEGAGKVEEVLPVESGPHESDVEPAKGEPRKAKEVRRDTVRQKPRKIRVRLTDTEKNTIEAGLCAEFGVRLNEGERLADGPVKEVEHAVAIAVGELKRLGRTKDGSEQRLAILASSLLKGSRSGYEAGSRLALVIRTALEGAKKVGGAASVEEGYAPDGREGPLPGGTPGAKKDRSDAEEEVAMPA